MDLDTTMVSVPLRLLKQLEWTGINGSTACRVCGEGYKYGHRADCQLALAIKEVAPTEVRFAKEN